MTVALAVPAVLGDGPTRKLAQLLARPGTRSVLLAGSRDPNAKMTVVLVDEHGPAFVVKVPTTAPAAAVVRREGDLLAALRECPLGPLASTVPQPIGYLDADGMPALVTNALAGTPMSVRYHGWRHTARRRRVRRDFAASGAWLAQLQTRTAGAEAAVTLLHEALDTIGARFPDHPSLPALRVALAGPADRLSRQYTPRTVVHGDYWFGNLLVHGAEVVGVVDWEAGALTGEPLRDVARFAVSYALYLDRHVRPGRRVPGHRGLRAGSWGAGLAAAVDGRGWFGDLVRGYVETALHRLALPASLWSDVLLGGIAEVAAGADHPEFARRHLELLVDLTVAAAPPARVDTTDAAHPTQGRLGQPSTAAHPAADQVSAGPATGGPTSADALDVGHPNVDRSSVDSSSVDSSSVDSSSVDRSSVDVDPSSVDPSSVDVDHSSVDQPDADRSTADQPAAAPPAAARPVAEQPATEILQPHEATSGAPERTVVLAAAAPASQPQVEPDPDAA